VLALGLLSMGSNIHEHRLYYFIQHPWDWDHPLTRQHSVESKILFNVQFHM